MRQRKRRRGRKLKADYLVSESLVSLRSRGGGGGGGSLFLALKYLLRPLPRVIKPG